jgi:DNA-binding transcriptional LysR family regulator
MERPSPPFNFNRLRLFLAVADHGGITRGAAAIFVSQPAVSKAIQELERDVGVPLLEHVGRGVVLTDAGVTLADYARRLFALADEGRRAMDRLKGLDGGRLALSASTTAGAYLLPRALGVYHRRHPAVALSLDVGNAEQALGRLRSGSVEMAMIEDVPAVGEDLATERVRPHELVLVAAPDHPFARAGLAEPAEIGRVPFLVRERGSGTRATVDTALASYGISPAATTELGHTEAIKQAVAAGLGVSVLSRLTVEREARAGVLAVVPIYEIGSWSRWLLLAWRRSYEPTAAALALRALLATDHG